MNQQILVLLAGRKRSLWREYAPSQGAVLNTKELSFKGLEADAVVIADVPPLDSLPYFTVADVYVACSRAKHLLVIPPLEEGILN